MKLEDPQETWEFFNKVAGETYVTNVSGFQQDAGSLTVNYMDTRSTSVDRRQRIEILDLRDQREGQAHVFFKSTIVRAELFYANPKPVESMRITHFLKVEVPPDNELLALEDRLKQFGKVFNAERVAEAQTEPSEDIMIIQNTLAHAPADMPPVERGVTSLISLLEHEISRQAELSSPYEDVEFGNQMSAFTKIDVTPLIRRMIGEENVELYGLPLIRRGSTLEDLKHIERLTGKDASEAEHIAESILRDVENVTTYPPGLEIPYNKHKFMQGLNQAIEMFGGQPYYDAHMLGRAKLANIPDQDLTHSIQDLIGEPELPELPDEIDDDLEALLRDEFDEESDEDDGDKT